MHYFTEEDHKKLIEFLNLTAKKAKFNDMDTFEIIEYFKLLSHMQKVMLPKIEANIFEIKKVTDMNSQTPPEVPKE